MRRWRAGSGEQNQNTKHQNTKTPKHQNTKTHKKHQNTQKTPKHKTQKCMLYRTTFFNVYYKMAESARPRLLNIGGDEIEKAIYIEPESAAIVRLAELRDAGKLNISELPTSYVELIFESTLSANKLDILEFILDANPLTVDNRQIYKVFLNKKPPFPTALSILNRAIMRKKVSLIQKLIAYGADVNEVHPSGMKPLDYAGSTTVEIYNILKTAGATSASPFIFTAKANYSIFLVHFADVDISHKIAYSLFSIDDKILPSLSYDNSINLDTVLIINLFRYAQGLFDGTHIVKPSAKVYSELWDIYKISQRFDAAFEYHAVKRPMFSQKGSTCASDATFTVLIESPKLSPLWTGIDFSKASNNNAFNYLDMFQAAQVRRDRFAVRNLPRGPLRRQESVQNDVWKFMHEKIACPVSGGVPHEKSVKFLTDIFELNKLTIPALQTHPFSIVSTDSSRTFASTGIDPARIVAILVKADQINIHEAHMYGFFRNETGGWMLADNEVGFLHTFQDNYWVTNTFIPRLDLTIETPNFMDLDTKVLIYLRTMDEIDLHSQFITLGSKFYPNIDVQCVFNDMDHLSIPTHAIYIVENPPAFNPNAAPADIYAEMMGPYGLMMPAAPAPNMSNLARRLEALRRDVREPEAPIDLNARLRALRGSSEGGRRKSRRQRQRQRQRQRTTRRRKTFSRRK